MCNATLCQGICGTLCVGGCAAGCYLTAGIGFAPASFYSAGTASATGSATSIIDNA